MNENEKLLESLVEAIRHKRRNGPGFPTPFDLSKIVWDSKNSRIEMDLIENGEVVMYDLLLDRVDFHGQTSSTVDENESSA